MNLFIFDKDPKKSAEYFFAHDRLRASNQIKESAQMLAIGCKKFGMVLPIKGDGKEYKTNGHKNHPMTEWTVKSLENFELHFSYFYNLNKVFNNLTGKNHEGFEAYLRYRDRLSCSMGNMVVRFGALKGFKKASPIFIGMKEYMETPLKITSGMSVYDKYKAYLFNKHHFDKVKKRKPVKESSFYGKVAFDINDL